MRHAAIYAIALLAAAPHDAGAQVSVIDEGSFTIMRGGTRIGREDFVIRQTEGANGTIFTASSTGVLDDRRLAPALRADSAGSPIAFQLEAKTGSEVQERLVGQIGRGRASVRVRTPSGEATKEYVVSDGAVVLDDDIFHQYFFLARGNRTGSVPVVIPRRNVQVTLSVESRGMERVSVGGASLSARHLVVTDPAGGARDVWVDDAGRVLKVELRDRGIVALRDEPPR